MFELWFGTFLAEGILFLVPLVWKIRRSVAIFISVAIFLSSVWICIKLGLFLGLPFAVLALFRLINMARIVKDRMHTEYLKQSTERTSRRLMLMHPTLVLILLAPALITDASYLKILVFVQLFVAIIICTVILRNIVKLKFKMPNTFLTDRELPTVTVAIPARNETTDLQECLNSIIASDYPKLEIIVLDDCSQGKTAEIIKSFAQDGVRFIQGEPPSERWLAKNQAYQQLSLEASGDLILFCGVDVRLGPQAIKSMVNLLRSRNKSMLSVLPVRWKSSPMDAIIQPMRYWWELALPRRYFNRPAVLSTAWIIESKTLKRFGGFSAITHAVLPEGFFARELVKTDQYSFIRSSGELEIKTTKGLREQLDTAVRSRYPQIRRRPEWALVITVANILFLQLPFVFLASSLWVASINPAIVGLSCVLLVVSNVAIVSITDPTNSLIALFSFPIAAVSELIIGYVSMIQYEFFTVSWKERNICIPVMHTIPRLPNIDSEVGNTSTN